MLHEARKVLEVFPDEELNAWVIRDGLVRSIRELVMCEWSLNSSIVEEGDGDVRDLRLEGERDIGVECGDSVRPTHGNVSETIRAKGGKEGGEVV